MLRKEAGNSSSEAPKRGCGPWGVEAAASAQPLLSRGVISEALQNGWELLTFFRLFSSSSFLSTYLNDVGSNEAGKYL